MITVRFPNGQAVQYNSATHAETSGANWWLYTKKDGTFIASAPQSCIMEYVAPCRVYNPLTTKAATEIAAEVGREVKHQLTNATRRKKAAK